MPTDDDVGSAATLVGATQLEPGAAAAPTAPPSGGTTELAAATPTLLADRYEILGLLGAGGMGRVYRAHDRTLDEVVALKLLRRELLDTPGTLERFRQEVRLARRVTSEHVVRTFDLGQHGDDHFLTMEYVDGRSLTQLLEDGPLPLDEVLRIARGACAGMKVAHAAGVLHRDLKPDNILVARSGRIAITDFGIAQVASDPGTTQERFAGTPAYMAPEQVEGKATIGPASDVYALGAILFEMLTRRRPFVAETALGVAVARLTQAAPDPRAFGPVPDALAAVVLRCLARDPTARFADGGALGEALATLAEGPGPAAAPAPVTDVPAKSSRAVAILPLRASGALAELAEGLSEEIVDALSMTRALRVRPLTSVRARATPDGDARALGEALGVDVVVDGSVRKRGPQVRIAARAIGVTDGFQLWASHVDAAPDELLAAGDEIARAVAQALTVELAPPTRAASNVRATELYLENKARVRTHWIDGNLTPAVVALEEALALAPDDAGIVATLAMALARQAFYGTDCLPRARALAERAVALAPSSGEAWFALAITLQTGVELPEAARALRRAVACAPGFAMAQAALGAVALEAGALDEGLAHLEGAWSIDPTSMAAADLSRAYVYQGRHADAEAVLESCAHETTRLFAQVWLARFRMWRGERLVFEPRVPPGMPSTIARYGELVAKIHRTKELTAAERDEIIVVAHRENSRLRASRFQLLAELQVFCGDLDGALASIEHSVTAGLQDHLWIEQCPMLTALRPHPAFAALADVVRSRASAVLGALGLAG